MFHVKKTKSLPLHLVKSNSKSLSTSCLHNRAELPPSFFLLISISKETISDSDEEME